MNILHDPKSLHRVQPDERADVAYLVRIPTVVDRAKFRHAVRAEGAKQWSEVQMLAGLEDGVRAVMSSPEDAGERDRLLDAIEAYRTGITTFASDVRSGAIDDADPVEFMKLVAEQMRPPAIVRGIERVIIDHYPPYAAMVADREVYQEVAGLVACRLFLAGWEGIDAEFRGGRQGVPDEVLARIPSGHMVVIGAEVERLLEPSQVDLKNSRSPSGGPPGPATSNGTETPAESAPSPRTGGTAKRSASTG